MHDYLLRPEVARVALVLGVVVSMVFYERTQLTSGGAILPAYLALFLAEPLFVVTTLVVGYATYVVVNRVIALRFILYGRRKFELEVLVGLALISTLGVAAGQWSRAHPVLIGLSGVGMLLPGILAHDMFRQGPGRTLLAVLVTTGMIAVIIFVFSSLLEISSLHESPLPRVSGATGYPLDLLVVAAGASVLSGLLIHVALGLRSGGFISAAYLALFVVRPLDLLWAIGLAVAVWFVCTRLVLRHVPVFGRRKLSTFILVGSVMTWTAEVVVASATDGAFQPWRGFVLMAFMIPSLIANDAQRQGLEKTLWGTAIATCLVFGVMNLLDAGLVATGAI